MAARIPAELGRDLAGGRCVLFLGAGFSIGATRRGWDDLLADLRAALGAEVSDGEWDGLDPLSRAQLFVDRRGREALEDLLREVLAIGPGWPGDRERDLLSLPVEAIITTNYDDLVERTLSDLGIPFRVLVDEADVLLPPPVPEMRLVVKMHGDLRTSDTIVLTRDDYREYATRRPAMARLVSSLFLTRRPLFHGFGMTDANFRGLYDQIVSLLPPGSQPARAYAFARRADPQFTASWRARGVSVVDCEDWEEMDRCIRRLSRRVRGKRRARTDLTRLAETLGAPDVVEDLVDVHDRLAAAALAAVEEWEGVPPGTRGGQRERAAARTRLSAAIRALLHLDRAGLPSASSPELRARIGEALLDLRADGEAREALEAAWAASSGRLRARSRRALAVAYHRLGDPRSAWRLWAVESEIEGEGEAGREVALGDASRALDAARAVAESMLRWGRTRAARAFVLEALARFGPAVRTFEGEVWPEGPAARRTVGWGCVRVAQAHVLLARCCGGPQGDEARAAHGEAAERLLHRASVLLPAGERRVALGELAALGSGADGGRPRPEDLERLAAEGRVPS